MDTRESPLLDSGDDPFLGDIHNLGDPEHAGYPGLRGLCDTQQQRQNQDRRQVEISIELIHRGPLCLNFLNESGMVPVNTNYGSEICANADHS